MQRFYREDSRAKQGNGLIGCSLSGCLGGKAWLAVVMVVLMFHLLRFTCIDSAGVLFCSHRALEPSQANGLLVSSP